MGVTNQQTELGGTTFILKEELTPNKMAVRPLHRPIFGPVQDGRIQKPSKAQLFSFCQKKLVRGVFELYILFKHRPSICGNRR